MAQVPTNVAFTLTDDPLARHVQKETLPWNGGRAFSTLNTFVCGPN
ncbi:MAG TPA: hypothetical protein VF962_08640 [Gemmatimonadaceae bacterium]